MIRVPSCSRVATARLMLCFRFCSSGSWSSVEVPESTLPSRWIAPASKSIASARLVLPAPPWEMRAMLRIRSGEVGFMVSSKGADSSGGRPLSCTPAAVMGGSGHVSPCALRHAARPRAGPARLPAARARQPRQPGDPRRRGTRHPGAARRLGAAATAGGRPAAPRGPGGELTATSCRGCCASRSGSFCSGRG